MGTTIYQTGQLPQHQQQGQIQGQIQGEMQGQIPGPPTQLLAGQAQGQIVGVGPRQVLGQPQPQIVGQIQGQMQLLPFSLTHFIRLRHNVVVLKYCFIKCLENVSTSSRDVLKSSLWT